MATLLELEDAIIDRLQDLIPEAHVSELPLDPAEIGVAVTATQIWVAFREEQFDPPIKGGVSLPLKPPSQGRRVVFELIIRGQDLRVKGHQRLYPVLDKIRDTLTGWMPVTVHQKGVVKPFHPVRAGFTNMGAGLWVYSQTFACELTYSAPKRI